MSNMISFTGRLGADSELRYTPNGEPVLSCRVASDVGFGDKKATNWFTCNIWGKRGESLQQYLLKGSQVTIFGTLLLREWTDKEGGKRMTPEVRVNEVTLHGDKKEGAGNGNSGDQNPPPAPRREKAANAPAPKQQQPEYEDPDSDIPF